MGEMHCTDTAAAAYCERLKHLGGARWKRVLDVQRPYRWNLRRLRLGATLDAGCGIGRNLAHLPPGSAGVDHNYESVLTARAGGLKAYTVEEFEAAFAGKAQFDSLLVAHVLEHMDERGADDLLNRYLRRVKSGGRVVLITPQERGFASDSTHVRFITFAGLRRLAAAHALVEEAAFSFPFPRFAGKIFPYNEFVFVARVA